ncbi:hypothetical protein RJI07_07880 [Mycoplasmatota bacterium WC30]
MKVVNYRDLMSKSFRMNQKGEFEKAYELFTDNQDIEDGCLRAILYLRCVYALLSNKKELGISIFKETVMDFGFWFHYEWMMKGKAFSIIRDEPTFKELAEICKKREENHVKNSSPELIIVEPKNEYEDSNKALLLVHPDDWFNMAGKLYRKFLDLIEQKVFYDHIIGYPISSFKTFAGSAVWMDIKKGAKELQMHYKKIIKQYNLDVENITLCAATHADIILEAIVDKLIIVKKLILIMPNITILEEIKTRLSVFKENDISVYIIMGEKDEDYFEMAEKFAKSLDELGVRNKFKIIYGVGHVFLDNYEEVLLEAKQYVNN